MKSILLITWLLSLTIAAPAQPTAGAGPRPTAGKILAAPATAARNRQVVESFYVALETQQFDKLRDIFAPDGRQINAFVPEGFPKSFEGAAEITKQYSALPKLFGQIRFARTIHATDDPNYFFVEAKGDIDLKAGGKYQNTYLDTFRLRDGRITEYTEYLNPLILAKAFNIPLK